MELKAYSIYDHKALAHGTPFFTQTDGLAVRMFADLVNDPRSTVSKHPKDFALYCIGTFNDDNANLTSEDIPILVMNATEVIQILTMLDNSRTDPVSADA